LARWVLSKSFWTRLLSITGFAFVTMPNQDQATAAIAGLNGKEINGFAIKVNEARPGTSRRSHS